MAFALLSQTSTYTGFYVHVKRIVVVQRPTQIREIERKRINIKRENE